MGTIRDDSTLGVKTILAHRAGFRCSKPSCRALTVGPSDERPDARTNVGVASHITGAAPGGPRYDSSLSGEDRRSVTNGIWLCQTHGKEIDDDEGLVESRHGAGWFVDRSAFHQRLAIGSFRHAASAVAEAGKTIDRHVVEFGYRPAPLSLAGSARRRRGHRGPVRAIAADRRRRGPRRRPRVGPGRPGRPGQPRLGDPPRHLGDADPARAPHRHASARSITAGLASAEDAELLGVAPGTPLLLVRRFAPTRPAGSSRSPTTGTSPTASPSRSSSAAGPSGSAAATAEPTGIRAVPSPEAPLPHTKEHIA